MAKLKRGWIYGGLVAVAAIAFFATSPQEEVKKGQSGRRPPRTAANSSTSKARKADDFTEQDQKASFARYEGTVANVFTPLVKRTGSGSGAGSNSTAAPNQIPAYLVGGDTGWLYTGTAYIDSVPSALVENVSNGQGEYLKVGQTFRNARVVKITPNTLVLSDTEGLTTVTLTLLENRPIVDDTNTVARSNNTPLNPMSGPIGITASQDSRAKTNTNAQNQTQNTALSTKNNSNNNQDTETNSEEPN